jgi:hypothetical protein
MFHISMGVWYFSDNDALFEYMTILSFTLYLFAFANACIKIIETPKPSVGKYYRYKKSFIGVDYYWIIPAQMMTMINWTSPNLTLMWMLTAFWVTVLLKGVVRQVYGDFYVLIKDNEIKVNENEEYFISLKNVSEVEIYPNKYKFQDNQDKHTLILLKRIDSRIKEEFKSSLDELIKENKIKTVYNNRIKQAPSYHSAINNAGS